MPTLRVPCSNSKDPDECRSPCRTWYWSRSFLRVSVDDTVALGFKDRFGLLVDAEWTAREQRKLQRRLHSAKLRYPTTLEAVPGGSGTPS